MIGLAFSHLGNAQNIGYIIPNEEIELFLKDIADGHYDGKPAMHDELQTLENPALRAFLKLDASVQGMVVHHPYESAASYPLKEWDVITRIADTPIDDEGMIKLGTNLRVNFRYVIQNVASSGKVPLTVVRAGKSQQIQLPAPSHAADVDTRAERRVPALLHLWPDGVFEGDPAVHAVPQLTGRVGSRAGLHPQPPRHPQRRCPRPGA